MIDFILVFYEGLSHLVIRFIPFVLLLVILVDALLKTNNLSFSYRIIRYTILINWILTLFILLFKHTILMSFVARATGIYWWIFWLSLIGSVALPPILLRKTLGTNKWAILIVSCFCYFYGFFEIIVIYLISFHADYSSNYSLQNSIPFFLLRPFIYGCFLIGIDLILMRFRKKTDTSKPLNENDNLLDFDEF